MKFWKTFKYRNTSLLIGVFLFSLLLSQIKPFHHFLFSIDHRGAIAGIAAGVLFVSTFTAPIGALMLLILAEKYSLINLWLAASVGATIADFTLYKLLQNNMDSEMKPMYERLTGGKFKKILNTKQLKWLFPLLGAAIILSPLPKQPGLEMLGIPKLKKRQFIALSAVVNIIGITFILLLSFVIKP